MAAALDAGTLDLEALATCSGRQGFNLLDLFFTPAHAASGCVLFDRNGKEITELTPNEREACVQMLATLMAKYSEEYLVGGAGKGELPGTVRTIASALRKIGSDEELVAGFQAAGMSAGFIRDLSVRLALGEDGYAEFKKAIEPLAAAGQLTKEAASLAIGRIAADHGLSAQDTKDLKLVAGVTTAVIIGAVGAKGGHPNSVSPALVPKVVDAKLANFVQNVYKGVNNPNMVGNGTLGDAVRYELASGTKVHGRGHIVKAEETIRGLQNWLRNTPEALAVDRAVAVDIISDLERALKGQ